MKPRQSDVLISQATSVYNRNEEDVEHAWNISSRHSNHDDSPKASKAQVRAPRYKQIRNSFKADSALKEDDWDYPTFAVQDDEGENHK